MASWSAARGGMTGTLWYENGMKDTRVLVVDDDPDIRSLLRVLLERAGHQVLDAPDGKAALREVFERRPDLVVLDVTMPELDGWKTLERIRDVSDVPVMMLTAAASEVEKVRALGAGADGYVVKPFGRQELVARVQALLRRAQPGFAAAPSKYADGFLSIDFRAHTVRAAEREGTLTPLEFRLLAAVVRPHRPGPSREHL